MRIPIAIIILCTSAQVSADWSTTNKASKLKPEQQKQKDDFEHYIEDYLNGLNKVCGTKVIVKTEFEKWVPEIDKTGPILGSCESVLQALTATCTSKAYRDVTAQRLKEVDCFFGGKQLPDGVEPNGKTAEREQDELTKANVSFKNGVLLYRMGKHDQNVGHNVQQVWEKMLNQ